LIIGSKLNKQPTLYNTLVGPSTKTYTTIEFNPLHNHAIGDHFFFFFLTLTNCDLNMDNQISYKLLQDYDYRQKENHAK
jgi:hypothetical protein